MRTTVIEEEEIVDIQKLEEEQKKTCYLNLCTTGGAKQRETALTPPQTDEGGRTAGRT